MVYVIFRVNTSGIYPLNSPCFLCLKITSFFTRAKALNFSIYAGLRIFYNPAFLPQFLSYFCPVFYGKKPCFHHSFFPNNSGKNKSIYVCLSLLMFHCFSPIFLSVNICETICLKNCSFTYGNIADFNIRHSLVYCVFFTK